MVGWKRQLYNKTYVYRDYNNTYARSLFGTNLPTSKISGNDYYYYVEVKNEKLIIGYQDTITEEKTDNFVITFGENEMTVLNQINNETYRLFLDEGYDKIEKGNAKLAYVCIAKKILNFKNPEAVKVTACYVDYETKIVYATIQATNSMGGTDHTDYELYELDGKYYITESSHNYSTNVDLAELNQKLQAYVTKGG